MLVSTLLVFKFIPMAIPTIMNRLGECYVCYVAFTLQMFVSCMTMIHHSFHFIMSYLIILCDFRILSMLKSGLIQKWRTDFTKIVQTTCDRGGTDTSAQGLAFKSVEGVFILLALGLFVSALILSSEILKYHSSSRKVQPKPFIE